jgi:Zn-dependent peptidase ImmA (M78 family)
MVPRLFALVHELKHHYVDQESIRGGELKCGDYNANQIIEKGAEVFAAEFIYPEAEMLELTKVLRVENGSCTAEKVVEFKRSCPAKVSYTFLAKRFEWFKFVPKGQFKGVQFQKLEESIYGLPVYKQERFKSLRGQKKSI